MPESTKQCKMRHATRITYRNDRSGVCVGILPRSLRGVGLILRSQIGIGLVGISTGPLGTVLRWRGTLVVVVENGGAESLLVTFLLSLIELVPLQRGGHLAVVIGGTECVFGDFGRRGNIGV